MAHNVCSTQSISSLVQNLSLQNVSPNPSSKERVISAANTILKKKSPLYPQFPDKNLLTTQEICMEAEHLLHDPKNGEDPFETFLQKNSNFRPINGEDTIELTFEASTRDEIEANYFIADQWKWEDLYDKDNLLLCLSSIKLNRPNWNHAGRIPKFMSALSECGCRATK